MPILLVMSVIINGINIIAAISWSPTLILHLFHPGSFEATPFFVAWLFWYKYSICGSKETISIVFLAVSCYLVGFQ